MTSAREAALPGAGEGEPEPEPDPLLRPRPFRRRELWKLVLLLALALVPRLAFFVRHQESPVFHAPIMDARYHDEWARAILSGEESDWSREVYFRAPLYPYVLAGIYAVSGGSIRVAVLVQHLVGAATVVLVYLLARRLFAEPVAWVAGLAAAAYWPLVYFEGDLLIETTFLFLNLAALLLLDVGWCAARRAVLLAAGVVFGLAAVARPTILLFLPFLPLAFLAARLPGGPRRAGGPGWVAAALLVWAGAALPIAPVIVRNWVVGRDVVPIASQGGVNFWIGNNPESDGQTAIAPGTRGDWMGGYHDTIRMAEQAEGRRLKPSEVSRHYFRKGWDFLVSSPGESLPLLWRKTAAFFGAGERANNKYIYFFWNRFGLASWPLLGFWIVGPLGLAGALLLLRRAGRFAALQLFLVTYSAGVIAFFVNARFRLPIVPVLIVFAAYAAVHVVRSLRTRGWRGAGALVLPGVLAVLVNLDWLRFQEHTAVVDAVSLFTLGNAHMRNGDDEQAIACYEQARRAHGENPITAWRMAQPALNFNLGRLYWQRGEGDLAVEALERVRGTDPPALQAKLLLAACRLERGELEDAVRVYADVLRRFPRQDQELRELLAPEHRRQPLEELRARAIEEALALVGDP